MGKSLTLMDNVGLIQAAKDELNESLRYPEEVEEHIKMAQMYLDELLDRETSNEDRKTEQMLRSDLLTCLENARRVSAYSD